jgi:hypothetical protein
MGDTVRLVTTQNTYLSISGFEAYTGAPTAASMRTPMRTMSTSTSRQMPMMKTGGRGFGGFGMPRRPMTSTSTSRTTRTEKTGGFGPSKMGGMTTEEPMTFKIDGSKATLVNA